MYRAQPEKILTPVAVHEQILQLIRVNINRYKEWGKSLDCRGTRAESNKYKAAVIVLEKLEYEIKHMEF